MKFVNVMLIALMLVAGAAMAGEKQVDSQNILPVAASRGTISGTLDGNSSTYDRIYSGSLSLECSSNVSDSSQNGTYFDIFCFQVSDTEPIEMICDPALTTIGDTYFTLYCDPFDMGNAAANVVFTDDDDGDGLLSAYFAADGISLTVGNTYFLVVTTFSPGNMGDYSIDTSANVMDCGIVATDDTTWDSLKADYR